MTVLVISFFLHNAPTYLNFANALLVQSIVLYPLPPRAKKVPHKSGDERCHGWKLSVQW